MNKIKVCLAQISTKLGDVESNTNKHIERIKESNADIICFPELSLTGYMIKDISFEIYDKCLKAIENIKRKIKKDQLVIVGSVIKNELQTINNGAFIIRGNEIVGNTKKFYLPTYGLFEEMRYFTPASPLNDLKVFEFKGINFGVIICEDA
jgi:predicted amidohydrolase